MTPSETFVTLPVIRMSKPSRISILMTPPGQCTEMLRSTRSSLCATAAAALLLLLRPAPAMSYSVLAHQALVERDPQPVHLEGLDRRHPARDLHRVHDERLAGRVAERRQLVRDREFGVARLVRVPTRRGSRRPDR